VTEAEWLVATDPNPMIGMLFCIGDSKIKGSERKQRLFACACARRVWDLLKDRRSCAAFAVAERSADGLAAEAEEMAAIRNANDAIADSIADWGYGSLAHVAACVATHAIVESPFMVAYQVVSLVEAARRPSRRGSSGRHRLTGRSRASEQEAQAAVLRDLFGNPFRPRRLDPAWLAWNAGMFRRLALSAYEERLLPSGNLDGARLAVLADALDEAGVDPVLTGHLREPGPHFRGCFVLDLLLGKE
jgi:hypothetical protein